MTIKITREQLLEPLQHVIGAIERRQTMPVLANVLVKFEAQSLQMTGTDLEVELISKTSIDADNQVEMTLPARKLLDICKNLPETAEISISQNKGKATLSSGRSRFVLSTLPANEFPSLDEVDVNDSFTVPQKVLNRLIEKTSFAMAQQDVRYYLNGLMLETAGSVLRAVATDGHRLSISEVDLGESLGEPKQVIVPRKGVMELQRLLADSEDTAQISITPNHIRVNVNGLQFTSKLIDGRFPDYQRVMPTESDKSVVLDKALFRQSLTRTSVLSNEKYRGVRLTIESGQMRIQTQNPDQEEAQEDIEIQYEGESVEIGFNVNYLLDVLNVIEDEKIEMALKDSNNSCLIYHPDEQNNRYVIMPMRL